MKNPEPVFSGEYVDLSPSPALARTEDPTQGKLEIDIEKYGISKPKRIIIRARISHDQD